MVLYILGGGCSGFLPSSVSLPIIIDRFQYGALLEWSWCLNRPSSYLLRKCFAYFFGQKSKSSRNHRFVHQNPFFCDKCVLAIFFVEHCPFIYIHDFTSASTLAQLKMAVRYLNGFFKQYRLHGYTHSQEDRKMRQTLAHLFWDRFFFCWPSWLSWFGLHNFSLPAFSSQKPVREVLDRMIFEAWRKQMWFLLTSIRRLFFQISIKSAVWDMKKCQLM